jgi:hypothetical protein
MQLLGRQLVKRVTLTLPQSAVTSEQPPERTSNVRDLDDTPPPWFSCRRNELQGALGRRDMSKQADAEDSVVGPLSAPLQDVTMDVSNPADRAPRLGLLRTSQHRLGKVDERQIVSAV